MAAHPFSGKKMIGQDGCVIYLTMERCNLIGAKSGHSHSVLYSTCIYTYKYLYFICSGGGGGTRR